MTAWPLVPLGEVLLPTTRPETVVATEQYRLLGAHWYAEGLYIKDIKAGSEIQANQLYRVEAGDFVYNRLFAWKGAFALAGKDVHGCFVSNEFPCFRLREGRVNGRYLHYYFSRESVWNEALGLSSGGTPTSRNRLKEDRLLEMSVPLPPIAEQRRVVEWTERQWHKRLQLEALQLETVDETSKLLAAEEMKVWPNEALTDAPTLVDVTEYLARGRQSEQGLSEHFLIKTQHVQDRRYVRSSLTLAPHIAAKVGSDSLVKPGDVLIACSAAGCLGRVAFFTEEQKASTDTHVAVARAKQDVVLPEYLYAYLRGAQGQYQLKSREQGDWKREKVSFRLTELNLADLRRVPIPLAGILEQRRIVDYLEKITAKINLLRELQTKRSEEVLALRSSILNSAFCGQL